MTYVIIAQMGLLLFSMLQKIAFWPLKGKAILTVYYAVIIFLISGYLTDISRSTIDTILTSYPVKVNRSVAVILEAILMIAYCFTEKRWQKLLSYYQGLLSLIAIVFFQTQVLFALPGINFDAFAWWSMLAVIILLMGGSMLVKWLYSTRELCHEMLFITNLLLIILCILITGII